MNSLESLNLILGRYDDPDNQLQDDYVVDIYTNNIAVFGTSLSGKTTLLKTLLVRMHQVVKIPEKEEIYILDFSNNLELYSVLPYIVGYFDASRDENVRRVFRIIEQKLSNNIKELHGKIYAECDNSSRPVHVTFILDGISAFFSEDRYTMYHEALIKFSREGISKGVTIVFTATEPAGGMSRMLTSFNRIIAFDLPKDRYSELFNQKTEKPINIKGRGIANIDMNAFEFQAYFPYDSDKFQNDTGESEAINELYERLKLKLTNISILEERKLHTFTGDLDDNTWAQYNTSSPIYRQGFLIAGLDYYSFQPISIDLKTAQSIAIYGRKESGKSNLLKLLLRGACKIPNVQFVLWDDGRNGLKIVKDITDTVNHFEIYKREEFEDVIRKGFFDLPNNNYEENDDKKSVDPFSHPFTVFVIQSRLFYQTVAGGEGRQLIIRLAPFINNASTERVLFVFSDVQRIPSPEARIYFNNCITHAFLLDDIIRFVNDRGQNSVFATQDRDDLKERFGRCEKGDGFYFNLETDELTKLRFIKVI